MSYQQNRNLWAELPQETSGISDAAEPPLEAVADFGHVQRFWVHQSQWLKMAEVWIAVVTWTSALPVVISTLDSHEEHHQSHDSHLQKIMALMALYLWTHGAKKGAMAAMVHVPPRHSGHLAKGSKWSKGIQGAASELALEISGLRRPRFSFNVD